MKKRERNLIRDAIEVQNGLVDAIDKLLEALLNDDNFAWSVS